MSRTLKLATMWKECDAALGIHAWSATGCNAANCKQLD